MLECCGEQGAELVGNTLNVPVCLSSKSQLWSWAVGWWPKQWDHRYKQLQWVSYVRWLDLEIGWRSGDAASLLWRSWLKWFGIRVPPGCLHSEIIQACPNGRRPQVDPELSGGIVHLFWSPRKNCKTLPGRRMSGIPCCHCDSKSDKWKKIDEWMDGAKKKTKHTVFFSVVVTVCWFSLLHHCQIFGQLAPNKTNCCQTNVTLSFGRLKQSSFHTFLEKISGWFIDNYKSDC